MLAAIVCDAMVLTACGNSDNPSLPDTTVLTECFPGEGELDYGAILRSIHRNLPPDAPVLLEHMNTFEEYRAAFEYVAAAAADEGIGI